MKNMLELILMEQRIRDQNQAKEEEMKEPLIESVDSEDQAPLDEGEK
jgi:hypothetical protein